MSEKKRPRTPSLRYFFYRDDLHKKIHIHRSEDIIVAWNYPQHKAVKYSYSDVRKNGEKAFKIRQVAEMLNRNPITVMRAINNGNIHKPQMSYGYADGRGSHAYFFNEKAIMELHDYLKTVHIGRPRKDGRINTSDLPTAAELRAMIRQGTVLYVKVGDEFVPTWRAERI